MFLTKSEIDLHLDIAQRVSRESNIDKAKVGCVNLYANGMVSFGWNQLPNDKNSTPMTDASIRFMLKPAASQFGMGPRNCHQMSL